MRSNRLLTNTLRKSNSTTSASPYRTQVQPAASFLVCSLIFIEYKIKTTPTLTYSYKGILWKFIFQEPLNGLFLKIPAIFYRILLLEIEDTDAEDFDDFEIIVTGTMLM